MNRLFTHLITCSNNVQTNMQRTKRTRERNSNDEVDDNNKEMWMRKKWDGRTIALQVYFWFKYLWCKVRWTVQEGEKSNIRKTILTQRVAKRTIYKSRELFAIRSEQNLLDYPCLKILLLTYKHWPSWWHALIYASFFFAFTTSATPSVVHNKIFIFAVYSRFAN
jgi:hypothetical protein